MTKTFDWDELDSLLTAGCKGSECAAYFGMHPDSLYRKVAKEKNCDFSAYLQERHSNGQAMLRAVQYAKAIGKTKKGDNTLLIWLGKQRLDQRENREDNIQATLASIKEKLENGEITQHKADSQQAVETKQPLPDSK